MTLTVSGFNYPGDKNHYKKYVNRLIPLVFLSTLETCLMSILDYYHLNVINFLMFVFFNDPKYRTNIVFIFLILIFAIIRFIVIVFIFSQLFISENIYKHADKKYFKNFIKYYLALILTADLIITTVLAFALSGLLLYSLFTVLYVTLYFVGLVIVVFLAFFFLFLLAMSGFHLNIFEIEIIFIGFLVIYTLVYALIIYKKYITKEIKFPIESIHKVNSVVVPKHNSFRIDQTRLVICKGKKIFIYNRNDLKLPLYVLKGHTEKIESFFFVNNFLVSISENSVEFGLWDIYNNYKFSDSGKNIVSDETIDQLSFNPTFYYYLVKNKNSIYANFSNFTSKSSVVLKIKEGFIIAVRMTDRFIYCLLTNYKHDKSIIQVWNLENKELLMSIEENTVDLKSFENLDIFDNFLVIYHQTKVIFYKQEETLIKIKTLDFNDVIKSIKICNSYLIINSLSHVFKKDDILNLSIYSKTSFDLLRKFTLEKKYGIQNIDNSNILLIDDKKNIFEYDLDSLFQ